MLHSKIIILAVTALLLGLSLPSKAEAHRLHPDRFYSGPVVTYYNGTGKFNKELTAYRTFINKSNLNVTLSETTDPTAADIKIFVSSNFSCKNPAKPAGVGGRGNVVLGSDCLSNQKTMATLSHEMSHALGLLHDDSLCALMNTALIGNGLYSRPTRCAVKKRNWYQTPLLADDIAGLREEWANTAPVTSFEIRLPSQMPPSAGTSSLSDEQYRCFLDKTTDREWNLQVQVIDYGDGATKTYYPARYIMVPNWPVCHHYSPGNFTVTLSSTDTYNAVSTVAMPTSVAYSVDPNPVWVN